MPSAARFRGLGETYDRFRPPYPAAAIAAILGGLPIQPTVVDVGAGTGISTRALMAGGAHAIAIEPNDEMRAVARAQNVDARAGTAASTGLADRCADAVTVFQAFHWFATREVLIEFGRLLRLPGRIALVWNERDTNDPFTAEYATLERRYCDTAGVAAIDFPDGLAEQLLAESGFGAIRRLAFSNPQRLDVDGVIGRMRSSSYAPKDGAVHAEFVAALRDAHRRHASPDGTVVFEYRTDVTLGERAAP